MGDALRSRVEPACSEAAEGGVVVGLDRRDVREHGWNAGEPLHEHCAMYLYTIESVPFRVSFAARAS